MREIATRHQNVQIVYPIHLNPRVKQPVMQSLSGIENIYVLEPQDYLPFIYLMNRADLILTDSGGVQEEAPTLGKPVLLMRNITERPEAVMEGTVKLVGTNTQFIVEQTERLLTDQAAYKEMAQAHNPYGDGNACARIINSIKQFYQDS